MKNQANNYGIKTCTMKGAVKDVDSKSRTVTGFYNTYLYLDSDGDILMPGCSKKSIKERGPESQATAKIKHALNHDLTTLPGKIVTLEEKEIDDVQGIYFETQMANTTLGNDTLRNYLEGVYDNHSIGFQYVGEKMKMIEREAHGNSQQWDNLMAQLINPQDAEGRGCVWTIGEIKMFEGSTVAFGANSLTPYLGMAKSMSKESLMIRLCDRIDKIQNTLKSGTQSDDMMMSLEVQCLQLKQMLDNLSEFIIIPTKDKSDQEKEIEKESTPPVKVGIDFKKLTDNFSLSK